MATSLHGRKVLKEEKNAAKSNACRNLIDPSKVRPNPSLSYFFSITITQPPKIRIKIPKILVKTMQRSEGKSSGGKGNDNNGEMKKKQVEPRKQLLTKKVGRIFFHVFGRRKTQETCSSNDDDDDASDLADDHKECTIKSSKNDVNDADEEEEKGKKKRQQQPKQVQVQGQGQSSFKSLFNKRNGLTLFRGKIARDNTKNRENGAVGTTAMVIGRQESSHYVPRVPSRILTTRQRLKMARSVRKMSIRGECEQEDGESVVKAADELCKKRILMGEKCKPLNSSGTLQYDEDGVLLPEIIP